MKTSAVPASRLPTNHVGTSFVSASIATNVQKSPTRWGSSPVVTWRCFLPT